MLLAPSVPPVSPFSNRTLTLTTQPVTIMGTFHQTHLGWMDTKDVRIVDLQGPPVWPWIIIQPKEAYILHKLPDELLLLIAKLSCHNHKQPPRRYSSCHRLQSLSNYENNCVMAFSQVCHRFKRIAQPLLFNTIILRDDDAIVPPSMRTLKLHRTLRGRVDLRQHCRWVLYFSSSLFVSDHAGLNPSERHQSYLKAHYFAWTCSELLTFVILRLTIRLSGPCKSS
jgi:hypothetical protein